jgi:hypothetical protein
LSVELGGGADDVTALGEVDGQEFAVCSRRHSQRRGPVPPRLGWQEGSVCSCAGDLNEYGVSCVTW